MVIIDNDDEDFTSSEDGSVGSLYDDEEDGVELSPSSSSSPLTPLHPFVYPVLSPSTTLVLLESTAGSKSRISFGRKHETITALSSPNSMVPRDGVLPSAVLAQGFTKEGDPRRPMNGFMIFSRWRRTELRGKHPNLKTGDISTKLSREWKSMNTTSKTFYLNAAIELKRVFELHYPDYKYIRRPNGTRKRGSRGGKTYIPRAQAKENALKTQQQSGGTSSSSILGLGGMSSQRWVEEGYNSSEEGSGRKDGILEEAREAKPVVHRTRRASITATSLRSYNGNKLARRTVSHPYSPPVHQTPRPSLPRSTSAPYPNSNLLTTRARSSTISIPSVPPTKHWSPSSGPSAGHHEQKGTYKHSRDLIEIRSPLSARRSYTHSHPPSYPPASNIYSLPTHLGTRGRIQASYPLSHPGTPVFERRQQHLQPIGNFVRGWTGPDDVNHFEETDGVGVGDASLWEHEGRSREEGWGGAGRGGGRVEHPFDLPQPQWELAPLQFSQVDRNSLGAPSYGPTQHHSSHLHHPSHRPVYHDASPHTDPSTPSASPYNSAYSLQPILHQSDVLHPYHPSHFQSSSAPQHRRVEFEPPSRYEYLPVSHHQTASPLSPEYHQSRAYQPQNLRGGYAPREEGSAWIHASEPSDLPQAAWTLQQPHAEFEFAPELGGWSI